MAKSGLITNLTIDGLSFTVSAESDFARPFGDYTAEGQATSGDNNIKYTKQVKTVEGIEIVGDTIDGSNLEDIINSRKPVKCSYTHLDGSVFKCQGVVTQSGPFTNQDNKYPISIIPVRDWEAIIV